MKREIIILFAFLLVLVFSLYPPTIGFAAKKTLPTQRKIEIDTAEFKVLRNQLDSSKHNLETAKKSVVKQKKIINNIKKNYYIDCSGC